MQRFVTTHYDLTLVTGRRNLSFSVCERFLYGNEIESYFLQVIYCENFNIFDSRQTQNILQNIIYFRLRLYLFHFLEFPNKNFVFKILSFSQLLMAWIYWMIEFFLNSMFVPLEKIFKIYKKKSFIFKIMVLSVILQSITESNSVRYCSLKRR